MLNTHRLSLRELLHSLFTHTKSTNDMNVQISSRGSRLLSDKKLAAQVINRVIVEHKKLDEGGDVTVINENDTTKVIKVSVIDQQFEEPKSDR